jgi:putative ABC transport system permease protein
VPAGTQIIQSPGFFRDVVAHIRSLPGVSAASAVASLPLTGDNISMSLEIEGQPTPMGSRPSADFNAVEPNYFRTVGASLVRGRDFTEQDNLRSTPAAIVNRTLAQRFFPHENPIGKHIRPGISNGYGDKAPMREIVGVIGDVKQSRLGAEAAAEVYAPLAQCPFDPMLVVVRTANDPRSIIGAARQQVFSLNKNAPLYHVKTLDQYFADSVAEPRLTSLLLGSFAFLAVLLACLGVYGVVSYTVAQRTHEIGVRMALGAERGDVVRWVLGRGLALALIGVTIGLAAAFALVHLLSTLLFGMQATDPVTFAVAPLALLGVATLASYIPARRAATLNPIEALRNE